MNMKKGPGEKKMKVCFKSFRVVIHKKKKKKLKSHTKAGNKIICRKYKAMHINKKKFQAQVQSNSLQVNQCYSAVKWDDVFRL